MKRHISLLSTVLIALLVVPAVGKAQNTSYDFDSSAQFSKFRTYAWRGSPASEYFLDKRIASAIDTQLAAKGLTKDESTPDLYVVYHVGIGVQRSVNGQTTGVGGGFPGPGGLDTFNAQLNELPVGALVIELVDASKRELVWRGVGLKEIDIAAKPEKRDAAIGKAVERILKNYPPKGGR